MTLRTPLLISVLALMCASLTTAAFGDEGPAPTVVGDISTEGGISAVVDWGGQAPVVLGQDATGDAPSGESDHDLTSIAAWVEDGDEPVLTFAWRMDDLTGPPPPEVIRYYWQFSADGAPFALQAKTSDFVSAANAAGSAEGIAANVASYGEHYASTGTLPQFRIRGNCETIVAVNSCGHVTWATGEFDTEADEIRFYVPLDSDATPALRPGARIVEDTNGAYSAIQAAADTTQTRDTVTQTAQYTIPERTATATLTNAGGIPTTYSLAVNDDGTVSMDQELLLLSGDYDVTVQACFAGSCGQNSTTLTVG